MGEFLLYSKFSSGEYLLYNKVSGGKVYYIANIPRRNSKHFGGRFAMRKVYYIVNIPRRNSKYSGGKVCHAEGLLYSKYSEEE